MSPASDGLQERVVHACCRRPRAFQALASSIERGEEVASVSAMLLLRSMLGEDPIVSFTSVDHISALFGTLSFSGDLVLLVVCSVRKG